MCKYLEWLEVSITTPSPCGPPPCPHVSSAGRIHVALVAIEVLLLLSTLTALSITACSDPGVVLRDGADLEQGHGGSVAVNSAQDEHRVEENERLTTTCRTLTLVVLIRMSKMCHRSLNWIARLVKLASSLTEHCHVERDATTHHCSDCNSCIIGLDHHCPWTGKCIGGFNLRYFQAFLATLCTLVIYIAVVGLIKLLTESSK